MLVGLGPIDLFADPSNHTVYVANYGAPATGGSPGDSTTVSMINSATCNATDLPACPTTPPPTVDVGAAPNAVAVNLATHSAYVTTIGALNGWTVFDTNTCNATDQSGCGSIGYLAGDSVGPNDGEVDEANDTLYTANYDNTISAFGLRDCSARDLAGCASDTPGTVTFPYAVRYVGFDHALYVAVDAPLHSVYVSYQGDDALAVVDTRTCDGSDLNGCATLDPRTVHTRADPEGLVLDSATQTLYTANEVDNDVSVIDAVRCNARARYGCRLHAPAVAVPAPGLPAVDQAVHTAYVPSGVGRVSMIDTDRCNAARYWGCAQSPPQATVGPNPAAVAVDPRTGTVYVANFGSEFAPAGTVSVIDAATCNASDKAGCRSASTLHVPGGNAVNVKVDAATDTIYVATITDSGPDLLSVFNGATCNATSTAGCDQTPATLEFGHSGRSVGGSDLGIAVNQQTNTIYATNVVWSLADADSVYVIDGATCDAANTTGCDQTPATVKVGDDPRGLDVDPKTDTVYVANNADSDYAGTVSIINGATCNGANTSGCGQTTATTPAVYGAYAVAVDPSTHAVYVPNLNDTSVSIINGITCNATNTSGCGQPPADVAVGNYPFAIALDPAVGTAYVANADNTVSVIPLRR